MKYFSTFRKFWYIPVSLVIITTTLSLVASFIQTPKYSSTVKLLVIQRQGNNLDAYSAARSAETIASVLSQMIYTTSFFDRVVGSDFKIDNTFSTDLSKRKKEWEQLVTAKATGDGALVVDVHSPNKQLSEGYALAIAYVLVNYGNEYHGGDNQVEIKMVDQPYTSSLPSSPNILQNTVFGVFAGVVISVSIMLLLVFREESKYELKARNAVRRREHDFYHAHSRIPQTDVRMSGQEFEESQPHDDVDVVFTDSASDESISEPADPTPFAFNTHTQSVDGSAR